MGDDLIKLSETHQVHSCSVSFGFAGTDPMDTFKVFIEDPTPIPVLFI
jgi:hypothetical protein